MTEPELNLSDSGLFENVVEPKNEKAREAIAESVRNKAAFDPNNIKPPPSKPKAPAEPPPASPEAAPAADEIIDPPPFKTFDEIRQDAPEIELPSASNASNEVITDGLYTTSEFIWVQLENGYPEIIHWLTKINEGIVPEQIPTGLQINLRKIIQSANSENKRRLQISEYHKKSILPPLKAVLSKHGMEEAIGPELQLVIGILMLTFDSWMKVNEIKASNKLIEMKIEAEIKAFMTQMRNQQEPATTAAEATGS